MNKYNNIQLIVTLQLQAVDFGELNNESTITYELTEVLNEEHNETNVMLSVAVVTVRWKGLTDAWYSHSS